MACLSIVAEANPARSLPLSLCPRPLPTRERRSAQASSLRIAAAPSASARDDCSTVHEPSPPLRFLSWHAPLGDIIPQPLADMQPYFHFCMALSRGAGRPFATRSSKKRPNQPPPSEGGGAECPRVALVATRADADEDGAASRGRRPGPLIASLSAGRGGGLGRRSSGIPPGSSASSL